MSLIINRRKPQAAPSRWEEYAPGIRIHIVSLDEDKYQIAAGRINRIIQRRDTEAAGRVIALEGEEPVYDQQREAVGTYLITGWEGVEEIAADAPEGTKPQPAEYTSERATALLKGDTTFFAWVLNKSAELAADLRVEAGETKGKLSRGSAGKSSKRAKPESASSEPTPDQAPSETQSPAT